MKKVVILITALIAIGGHSLAQDQPAEERTPKAYYLDGDDVVFVFDIRDYQNTTEDKGRNRRDFADLEIDKVAVTGEFNQWSKKKGWELKKVGEYTYQLRKSLDEFGDAFPVEFKYVINDQYWAEPGETFPTIRKFNNKFYEDTYNLTLYDVVADIEGDVFFFLEGHLDATSVILTGTFVDWDESYLKMKKVEAGWELRLDLRPDRYEYKFIVDGEWIHDTGNPNKVMNEHGTWNSILQVARNVRFELDGHEDAKQVALVGSFNHWSHQPMIFENDRWVAYVPLATGKYHYKFAVDGRYMPDGGNPLSEKNNEGDVFSVKIVQ